jgi:large subunit ribosomal protein L30
MFDNFLGKNICLTQISSEAKMDNRQKKSLIGLGLRGIGTSAILKMDESIMGMVKKVHHKIKIDIK